MYKIKYHKKALKDIYKLKTARLSDNAQKLIHLIKINPFQNPPPYEKLVGNLDGYYSRRINITHRLIYTIDQNEKVIKIMSMWSHYDF